MKNQQRFLGKMVGLVAFAMMLSFSIAAAANGAESTPKERFERFTIHTFRFAGGR